MEIVKTMEQHRRRKRGTRGAKATHPPNNFLKLDCLIKCFYIFFNIQT